jgi:excisionase family DNA binding protein
MKNNSRIEQQLTRIEQSLTASKEVLTFAETATFTGISKSYLYKLTSAGLIPHSKPTGKLIYFNRAEVQAWLLSRPIKTSAQINAEATNYISLKTGRP